MQIKRGVLGLLLLVGVAGACSAISGLDGFELVGAGETTGGGAGGGAGGSGPGTEVCGNSSDDDGDALPDCTDPDCAAEYTCVSLAMAPMFVARGDTCAEPFTTLDLFDCDACDCAFSPGYCGLNGIIYDNTSCNGMVYTDLENNGCTDMTTGSFGPTVGISLYREPSPSGGACSVIAPDLWQPACRLRDAALCDAGAQLCAPQSLGFECVLVVGEQCPADFAIPRRVRTSSSDCNCFCGVQESCPLEVTLYPNNNCGGSGTPVVLNYPTCTVVELNPVLSVAAPRSNVTCTAGSAPADPEQTLCCKP